MKILLVEDDHRIAVSLKEGLEQEGMTVELAFNGQSGLDTALEGVFTVIILDNMLPIKDGLTVCKELRSQKNTTPILFLTAKNSVADTVAGLQAGADDYLPKPFAFSELLARIHALARRSVQLSETVLQVDDLQIEVQSGVVTRGGEQIKLSKKEFALLHYLLTHAGKTVSKQQIINAVWEHESEVMTNTVEAYIGYLRKKIEAPFPLAKPLIQTHRGFGYSI